MKRYGLLVLILFLCTCQVQGDIFTDAYNAVKNTGETAYNGAKLGVETVISVGEGSVATINQIGPMVNDITNLVNQIKRDVDKITTNINQLAAKPHIGDIADKSFDILFTALNSVVQAMPLLDRSKGILDLIGEKIIGPIDPDVRNSIRSISTGITDIKAKVIIITQQLQHVLPMLQNNTRIINTDVNEIINIIGRTKF